MTSIRTRLTRDLLVVILLLEALGAAAFYLAARYAVYEAFDQSLDAKALAISTLTSVGPQGVTVTFSDRFFRGFDDRSPRDFFEIWDEAGQVVARSESFPTGELERRVGTTVRPLRWNLHLPDGRPARGVGFVFQPKFVTPAGTARPNLRLVVATRSGGLEETLWQLLSIAFGTLVVVFGGTILVIPSVLRRGLGPLHRLGEQVTRIDAGSLAERLGTPDLPRELKPIAERLNELLGRLQHSFDRERRFSADLAHELRTPVAELKSAAECALKWPDARDPQTDRDTLAIANQMEALVTHMLALARGESRKASLAIVPIALQDEVTALWAKVDLSAKVRGLNPLLALEAYTVEGDLTLLRSILINLFDNAADYAAVPGTIEIAMSRDDNATRLKVSNFAPDLDEASVAQLFDRFWRREEARTGGRHLGLGLALARELASAQEWALTADLRADHWLTFTLSIPRIYRPCLER